jgi:hypothetical protein
MLVRHALLCLACAAPAYVAWAGPPTPPGPSSAPEPPAIVLDERDGDYREDVDPSRVIARWHARIDRDADGRTRLAMAFSAIGARVVPPPGAEGVAGANAITAEEIERILAEGRAEVRVARDDARLGGGRVRAGRAVEVPTRRVAGADVAHVPHAGRTFSGEALVEADLPGDGRFVVDVLVDGRPRARATCHVRGSRARILALESLPSLDVPAGARP